MDSTARMWADRADRAGEEIVFTASGGTLEPMGDVEPVDRFREAERLCARLEAGEITYAELEAEAEQLAYADEAPERPAVSEARQREMLAEKALEHADAGTWDDASLAEFVDGLCYSPARDRLD